VLQLGHETLSYICNTSQESAAGRKAMQKELQAIQDQLAQTKKQAQAAQTAVQSIPANLYNQASPGSAPMVTKGPPSWFDSVHISMAGRSSKRRSCFASIMRSRPVPAIRPLAHCRSKIRHSITRPLYYENEFRASAQQSRIAFRAYGDIPVQHLQAYYESDFLGAGVTTNSRESNSYNLRIRQA
jgi:hypothetical protein